MLGAGAEHGLTHQPSVWRAAGPDLDRVRTSQADPGVCPVRGLGGPTEASLAHGHTVREGPLAWSRHEFRSRRDHHPKLLPNGFQGVLQVPYSGPPELIGVVVDHPVGPHLGRDSRDLLLAPALHVVYPALDALEPHEPRSLVALEDLERSVGRPCVDDDEEINPKRTVKAHVVLEDVRLVPDLVDHSQPHGAARLTGPPSREPAVAPRLAPPHALASARGL